jgi:hypothetical protein
MPNTITLINKYIALLDEVYKQSTLTADLEAAPERIRQGNNARQILFPYTCFHITGGIADFQPPVV